MEAKDEAAAWPPTRAPPVTAADIDACVDGEAPLIAGIADEVNGNQAAPAFVQRRRADE